MRCRLSQNCSIQISETYIRIFVVFLYKDQRKNYANESTAGADASVEMQKLHNIKQITYDEHFLICICMACNSKSG